MQNQVEMRVASERVDEGTFHETSYKIEIRSQDVDGEIIYSPPKLGTTAYHPEVAENIACLAQGYFDILCVC